MASCWVLVTKLLKVLFKEIHKVCMFAATLATIKDDPARVNGLFFYVALEELQVLREFDSYNYRRHPKYNQMVVLHLFDTSLPRAIYERGTNGPGRDGLCFTKIENTLSEHKTGLDRLETSLGSIRFHLQMPPAGGRQRRGTGANSPAVSFQDVGVQQIE
jgi:hypothetical protein